MKIGYARVSTKDQNLELQTAALQKAGCEKIYKATQSAIKDGSEFQNTDMLSILYFSSLHS